jgi:hypothetical protein
MVDSAEYRLRQAAARRQRGRCEHCGRKVEYRIAPKRQLPVTERWVSPLPRPVARAVLLCPACAG